MNTLASHLVSHHRGVTVDYDLSLLYCNAAALPKAVATKCAVMLPRKPCENIFLLAHDEHNVHLKFCSILEHMFSTLFVDTAVWFSLFLCV